MDDILANSTDATPYEYHVTLVERSVEAAILIAICLTALLGNISLWIIVVRDPALGTTSNWLFLCLSAADILVSAVNMPIVVVTLVADRWIFSQSACVVFGFITMVTFVCSVMSLGVISLNRYVMICRPHTYVALYTKRKTWLMIAGVWLLAILLALLPLLGWGRYDFLPGQSFCFCDWKTSISYTFFMVAACFGGPCSVMIFCYVKIWTEVQASKKRLSRNSATFYNGNKTPKAKPMAQQKLKMDDKTVDDVITESRYSMVDATEAKPTLPASMTSLATLQVDIGLSLDNGHIANGGFESARGCDSVSMATCLSAATIVEPSTSELPQASPANGTIGDLVSVESNNIELQFKTCIDDKSCGTNQLESFSAIESVDNGRNQLQLDAYSAEMPGTDSELETTLHGADGEVPSVIVPPNSPSKDLDRSPDAKTRRRNRKSQDEIRLATSFAVVIVAFILCWLPFCVTMFMSVFMTSPVPRVADMATLLLGCANSCCNPIIYGVTNRKFRQAYRRMFTSCCARRIAVVSSTSSGTN